MNDWRETKMLQATRIRMEYLEEPVGFGELPWFGWVLESDRKGVIQQGYQLQIATDEGFETLVYDSGWKIGRAHV